MVRESGCRGKSSLRLFSGFFALNLLDHFFSDLFDNDFTHGLIDSIFDLFFGAHSLSFLFLVEQIPWIFNLNLSQRGKIPNSHGS